MKKSSGDKIFLTLNNFLMLFLSVLTLYPVLYVIFASFSEPVKFIAYRGILLKPIGFSVEAYKLALENPMIGRGYLNTIFIVVVGVAINILMTSMGAYFLSRKGVMWKKFIMFAIVFTMFFGGGLIPFYLTVKQLNLTNTLWALIIPGAIGTYNMIIMRTSFMGIPDSLEESAKIDGARHFTILFRIFLPLSLPVIAVMVLYYGVGHWNSWFGAMIFLRNRELYPLQLILREILIQNSIDDMIVQLDLINKALAAETIKYAVIIISTVPVLALYPFLQKYFVKGVLIGSLKE